MNGRRWAFWGTLLVAAAVLVAYAPPPAQDTAVVDAVRAAPRVATAAAPADSDASAAADPSDASPGSAPRPDPMVLRVHRRTAQAELPDGRLWRLGRDEPAPPPPRRAVPPPQSPASAPLPAAPTAPTPPFRMIGRYEDGDRRGVVLQGPDGGLSVVHAGDPVGDGWQVESLAGDRLVLRYLPLDQRMSMDMGYTR